MVRPKKPFETVLLKAYVKPVNKEFAVSYAKIKGYEHTSEWIDAHLDKLRKIQRRKDSAMRAGETVEEMQLAFGDEELE